MLHSHSWATVDVVTQGLLERTAAFPPKTSPPQRALRPLVPSAGSSAPPSIRHTLIPLDVLPQGEKSWSHAPSPCPCLSPLFPTLLESKGQAFFSWCPMFHSFMPHMSILVVGESSSLHCRRHLSRMICSTEVQRLLRTKTLQFTVLCLPTNN